MTRELMIDNRTEGGIEMNKDNYGTQPACQRLLDAGIVLETDFHWVHNKLKDTWKIGVKTLDMENHPEFWELIPAVQLAEVWRELPQDIKHNSMVCSLMMWKFNKGVFTEVGYWWHEEIIKSCLNENPTDALIDLLIWTV
jgi:hypothetical protein